MKNETDKTAAAPSDDSAADAFRWEWQAEFARAVHDADAAERLSLQTTLDTLLQVRYGRAPVRAQWAAVERGIAGGAAPQGHRLRPWRWAPWLAAAAAALVWLMRPPPGESPDPTIPVDHAAPVVAEALLRTVTPGCRALAPDGTILDLQAGTRSLPAGTRIETETGSCDTVVGLNAEIAVRLGEETSLTVALLRSPNEGGDVVALQRGEILVNAPRKGVPFRITSPIGDVRVLGTRFGVLLLDEKTALPPELRDLPLPALCVAVESGAVALTGADAALTVHARHLALVSAAQDVRRLGRWDRILTQTKIIHTGKEADRKEKPDRTDNHDVNEIQTNNLSTEREPSMKLSQGTMMAALAAALITNSAAIGEENAQSAKTPQGAQAPATQVVRKTTFSGNLAKIENGKLTLAVPNKSERGAKTLERTWLLAKDPVVIRLGKTEGNGVEKLALADLEEGVYMHVEVTYEPMLQSAHVTKITIR
jgi:hypothetical protein